jgi:hypothetical protein
MTEVLLHSGVELWQIKILKTQGVQKTTSFIHSIKTLRKRLKLMLILIRIFFVGKLCIATVMILLKVISSNISRIILAFTSGTPPTSEDNGARSIPISIGSNENVCIWPL